VGSAPVNIQIVLRTRDGRSVRLTGPLAGELERLTGAEVSVEGGITTSSDPIVDRQIEATAYTIIAIDGLPVVWGEIVSLSGGSALLRTDAGAEVTLSNVPADFAVGQKVWVQGPQGVVVQSHGTIRP